jgi:hypothetical protein
MPEVLDLRDRANINFATYHRHFGHRFVLAGQKPARSPGYSFMKAIPAQ